MDSPGFGKCQEQVAVFHLTNRPRANDSPKPIPSRAADKPPMAAGHEINAQAAADSLDGSLGSALLVISETNTNVKKPSGIVINPGWLNGTEASFAASAALYR